MYSNLKIVLGSNSPRRKEILQWAGLNFNVIPTNYDEILPEQKMNEDEIPAYFATQKALSVKHLIKHDEILITADTLVFLDGIMMGKPTDKADALDKLMALSGKAHKVITGVCMLTHHRQEVFIDTTLVHFKNFDKQELEFYIEHYPVMDKAGAYGAQDWIGVIGIEKLEGSYFNVMGLPMHKVYDYLKYFLDQQ